MDGVHDLGGKQGFGPIAIDDDERPFHHDWEGREWGIAQCARTPGITIDWWRYCRELILPEDYLGRPYFDSWAQTDFATYIEAGWMTLAEVSAVVSEPDRPRQGAGIPAMTLQQVLQEDRNHAVHFDAEVDSAPAFKVGQPVIAVMHGNDGHSRLPQYARGRRGKVQAYNGAHVFPDRSAAGEEIHQHCYNVMFNAAELWSEAAESRDKVCLDLWESYLIKG